MKKRGYHIYLFRHGQTFYNRDQIFTGWKDSLLTPLGFKQAKIVAKKIKNKKFGAAFYTRLTRSKQTLKEVLRYHPECKKKIKDDRMLERNYGSLNGHHHSIIIKNYGAEQYNRWHRGYYIKTKGGESFADVNKRVKSFIVYLKKFMKKNKTSVAISAHGNSIRLFRHIWEKTSVKKTCSWFIPYDRVFTYRLKT